MSRSFVAAATLLLTLAGCQTVGPSRGAVEKAATTAQVPGLQIVDVTQDVAQQVNLQQGSSRDVFAADLGGAQPVGTTVGVGDSLEVTIWEAAPPTLFRTSSDITASVTGGSANVLPGFLVGPSGTISVPFAGEIPAAGRTVHQIEREIVGRLQGRAHLPQVVVRIARNVTSTVTVLGEVNKPTQMPLTPHGERILDAVSEAGGTTHQLDRMTIQLTRGGVVRRMPAAEIISNPQNNVVLRAGDVISAFYQPYSFTVLGAAGKNDEVPFEATGITLSQALGRVGGLQGDRADPKGVFIFRWVKPDLLNGAVLGARNDAAPGVPVIYRVDMRRPETYLAAQKFQMRDGDILYISNSPVADFQRFVGLIASSILPISTVRAVVP